MKKRSLTSDGKFTDHASGLGTVTKDMVSKRAQEIALINGREDSKPTPDDWNEAKRELTTTRGFGNDPAEEVSVDKRWDPVPGTRGGKADIVDPDDEQTIAETLVKEGVEEAEHEHMVEGSRESVERDREIGE